MLRVSIFAFAIIWALNTQMARSQSLESMQLATNLGQLLASEEFCGLNFDQRAILKFIDEKVSANDLGFTSTLNMMTEGARYNQSSMSESQKTAHCRQTERSAKSYGFIK